jgi:hypothetical protein
MEAAMTDASEKRIFLAGEGKNELGSWSGEKAYQSDSQAGVLKALLQQKKPAGWKICGATQWKNIRKYKAGDHKKPEIRNILGACLMAREAGCDCIAFSRDTDGCVIRQREIEQGILDARKAFSNLPGIIGACAIPVIEAWVIAVAGIQGTEKLSAISAKEKCRMLGNQSTDEMVAFIGKCGLQKIPNDAYGLISWLTMAEKAL